MSPRTEFQKQINKWFYLLIVWVAGQRETQLTFNELLSGINVTSTFN
jgi:hypothetical protein